MLVVRSGVTVREIRVGRQPSRYTDPPAVGYSTHKQRLCGRSKISLAHEPDERSHQHGCALRGHLKLVIHPRLVAETRERTTGPRIPMASARSNPVGRASTHSCAAGLPSGASRRFAFVPLVSAPASGAATTAKT